MHQVIMNYRTGNVELADVPKPMLKSGGIIVRNLYSAISVGTEKLMVKTGKSSLLKKAKDRPDLVKKVIDKLKTEGFIETYRQVVNRLDEPIALGYSCCGIVEEVANNVKEFKVGDVVACFGSGYASHADYVWVPKNLAVCVPDGVSPLQASFAGIASISLHAIRISSATLGDNVVVYGLGLLGLIAVQILKAMGCKVLGIDIDREKLKLARNLGCNLVADGHDTGEMIEKAKNLSNGIGVDSVIIFVASGGSDVLYNAANMARDKAKIVATGMLELEIPRKDFFEKELELVVSRGAGAGIFDEAYELKGFDYPIGYVKWTEKRNMEEILKLIENGKLNVDKLITNRFKIGEAEAVYNKLVTNELKVIGAVFEYDTKEKKAESLVKVAESVTVKQAGKRKDYITLG
ncbi:MAG: zinc-binding alcohol dehydrogenase, partial [Thermotogae bacterium]|nr:zinc-binding alcohol dehydrogenase [Thermotogota bacterium]